MSARLSRTAYFTRKFVIWGAVGLVVYVILYGTYKVALNAYQNREKAPPPPEVLFGELPYPSFPEQDPNIQFNYKLETISGGLPTDIPDRANVYINQLYQPNLLSYDRAQKLAGELQFVDKGIPVDPPVYRWRIVDGIAGLLEMNIYQLKFDMIRDWQRNERVYVTTNRQVLTEQQVFDLAVAPLLATKRWPKEWLEGQHGYLYYKYVNGQLVRVDHISKADFVQVNFKRADLDEMKFVSVDPIQPVVWVLVSQNRREVVEIHYNYQNIDEDTFTDYPVEPVAKVWNALQNNQAYIAYMGGYSPGDEVTIRHFDLAYFLNYEDELFTQPVYVIRGDRDFTAYYPAVDQRLLTREVVSSESTQ